VVLLVICSISMGHTVFYSQGSRSP